MKRRAWRLIAGAILLMGMAAGCKGRYQEVAITQADTAAVSTIEIKIDNADAQPAGEPMEDGDWYTFEERIQKDGKIRSFLTGEMVDDAAGSRRPIAIMMSNDKASLPQYGINQAGVVYEAPVEGDMNRYMAIIENYDGLERIGSVRSCRTYYTYFAKEFDAIYAHYGQSTFAKPYLANVDNINGLDGIGTVAYYRTKDRKSPHNAYSSGERLNKAIAKLGYSEEYSKDYKGHYRFAKTGHEVKLSDAPSVMDAVKIYPGYAMNKPWFEYNKSDGQYYRYQYGAAHMGDQGRIAVKNILFQYCPSGHYATTEYLDINVHDDSYGLYATEGKAIPVKWTKDGEFGLTHYYDMENHEVILNQGKTWICIISAQDSSNVKVYGE